MSVVRAAPSRREDWDLDTLLFKIAAKIRPHLDGVCGECCSHWALVRDLRGQPFEGAYLKAAQLRYDQQQHVDVSHPEPMIGAMRVNADGEIETCVGPDGVENWIPVEGQGTPTAFSRITGQLSFSEIRNAFMAEPYMGDSFVGYGGPARPLLDHPIDPYEVEAAVRLALDVADHDPVD